MKFYHVADIHLGAAPDQGKPWSAERKKGLWESFLGLLERAKNEGTDVVFICGDLFHRQPLLRELNELKYCFEKVWPMRIIMIAGNHDYISERSNYVNFQWSKNVTFIMPSKGQRIYIKELNACIYGLSYHHFEILDPLYDHFKPQYGDGHGGYLPKDCAHILLAHGGDEKHIPMDLRKLAGAGFDYIAMGHIHKPWVSPDHRMAYCGSLEPVDKNDEGPHGFIRGEISQHRTSIAFVPFAKYRYVPVCIHVTPEMSWEEIKDKLRSQIGGDLYKVTLTGYKNVDLVYDLREIYTFGKVVSVTDDMEYGFDFERLYEANKGNLLGHYMEKVAQLDVDEADRKKILYYGFNALYKTGEQ